MHFRLHKDVSIMAQPTEQQLEDYLAELKAKDPQADLRIEFGQFLLRHIDSLTIVERKRYDELKEILQ